MVEAGSIRQLRGHARFGAGQQVGRSYGRGQAAQIGGDGGQIVESHRALGALVDVLAHAALIGGIQKAGGAQRQQLSDGLMRGHIRSSLR